MKIFKIAALSLFLANSLFANIEFKCTKEITPLISKQHNRIEASQGIESIFEKYFTPPFVITLQSITTINLQKNTKIHKIRIINTPIGSIKVIDKIVLQRSTAFNSAPIKKFMQFTKSNLTISLKRLSFINTPYCRIK